MKRIVSLCALGLGLLLSTTAMACTNFLVTKGASADGSCMISYAADSHYLYGELYFWPAADYAKGAMWKVYEWDTHKYLGEIPQVAHTYSVVGNMNEHQLAIGETTYTGRKELRDSTGIIDYGSMIYLTLQRAKNAREAIKVMTQLVETYGYASTGESLSISDPNEVWVLEIIGKGTELKKNRKTKRLENVNKGAVWVARRIPDGYVSAHANQARITTFPLANGKTSITSKHIDKIFNPDVETVYAEDVIQFAKKKGYYKGSDKDFSFSDAYAPVDFGGARFCEMRVWAFFRAVDKGMDKYEDYACGANLKHRMPLWIKPAKKVKLHDVMDAMRDHLEGTKFDMTKDPGAGPGECPYRWRPLTWKYQGKEYVNERATATQQTGFVFVAQSRGWLPAPIGGILWFGVDDAASTVFNPMFCGMNRIPRAFEVGNGSLLRYSHTAAFWLFNKVANYTYLRYNLMHKDLRKEQLRLEEQYITDVPSISKHAAELYKQSPEKAIDYITNASIMMTRNTMMAWESLYQFLLVKYIDGNVKVEKNGEFQHTPESAGIPVHVQNPEYSDSWKAEVIKATGDKLEMKK